MYRVPFPSSSTCRRVRLSTTQRASRRTTEPDETSKLANILMKIPGAALSKDGDKTGNLVEQMLARLPGALRQATANGQPTGGFSVGPPRIGGGGGGSGSGSGGNVGGNRRKAEIFQADLC